MSPLRILIFSVDIGAGHKMAGRAVCAALERLGPLEARWIECMDYMGTDPEAAKRRYFDMLEAKPELWGWMYEEREAHTLFRPFSEWVDNVRVAGLRPVVEASAPDCIVAVHPFGCGFGGGLKRAGVNVPVVAVLTDFDGHPCWVADGVDRYFSATPELARRLERAVLPSGDVIASGIPLREAFWDLRPGDVTRAAMGLDPTLPVILLLGGGLGLGPIEEAARCLANQDQPCQVVLIAGRNADLEARARALARSTHHPLVVNGLVADMHAWMSVATLAVGKPGGLTTAELLACGVPMIALEPIPGQERANCDALVRHGAGIEATSPTSVAAIAGELLSDPARLQAMRAAAAGMGIRDGARTVAAHVVELAAAPRKALEADPITEMQVAAAEAIHDATELGKDIKKSLGGLFDKLKF